MRSDASASSIRVLDGGAKRSTGEDRVADLLGHPEDPPRKADSERVGIRGGVDEQDAARRNASDERIRMNTDASAGESTGQP